MRWILPCVAQLLVGAQLAGALSLVVNGGIVTACPASATVNTSCFCSPGAGGTPHGARGALRHSSILLGFCSDNG